MIKTILYITFILGMVFGYSPTSAAFVFFDNSYFGTGATCDDGTTSCDLTARVGRPVPLENRPSPLISLPPPTDGWNVVNMGVEHCGGAGRAELQRLINAHSVSAVQPPTLVVLPPCEIWVVPTRLNNIGDPNNGINGFQIPDDIQDYFHITGHAGGSSALIMKFQEGPTTPGVPSPTAPQPPDQGWRYTMFQIGAGYHNQGDFDAIVAELPMWAWTGGFALGDNVVTAAPISAATPSHRTLPAGAEPIMPVANLYEGDLIRLIVASWNDRPNYDNGSKAYHRVICSVWTDGTVHPAGSPICAPGGTPLAVGSIKLSGDLQFDMSGTNHYNGPFTGHTIQHLERKGGGTLTSFYPEYFGMSNFRISNDNPSATMRGYDMGIGVYWCTDCWITDMKFDKAWGNQWINVGTYAGRTLISGNDFEANGYPPLRSECVFEITSVSNTGSPDFAIQITGNTAVARPEGDQPPDPSTVPPTAATKTVFGQACGTSSYWTVPGQGNIQPWIWFPDSIGTQNLRNKRFDYTCTSGCGQAAAAEAAAAGTLMTSVLILKEDTRSGTAPLYTDLNAAWAADPSGDWGMQLNGWNISTIFLVGTGMQIINNSFHNMRVGTVTQNAGSELVYAYNSFMVDEDFQCSRSIFTHGSQKGPSLWEGNTANCGASIVGGSPQGLGINNQTLMNNRFLAQGRVAIYPGGDQCGANAASVGDGYDGGIAGLCNEHTGQNEGLVLYSSEDNNYIGNILEGVSNPEPLGSGDNNKVTGSEAPYQLLRPAFHKNVWIENMGVGSDFESKVENPTIIYPDFEDTANPNHGVNLAPTDWTTGGQQYPTSLLYDTVGAQLGWTQPAWWCDESGGFPNIGALYDDDTPGARVLSVLPADRRRLNMPCAINGVSTQSVTITSSSPTNIVGPGGLLYINWTSTGVERCWSADNGATQFFTTGDANRGFTWLWGPATGPITYTIECDDGTGDRTADVTDSITITVVSAPVATLSSDTTMVEVGSGVVLTWEGSGGSTSCQGVSQWTPPGCVDGSVGPYCSRAVPTDGQLTGTVVVNPEFDTTYQFQCYSPAGPTSYDNAYVTIYTIPEVDAAPTVTLSINPSTIADGGTSVLTWSSTGPTSHCVASGFAIPVSDTVPSSTARELSGSITLSPSVRTTYVITCTSTSDLVSSSMGEITVTSEPTALLNISTPTIVANAFANLTWSSTHAAVCHGDGPSNVTGFVYTDFDTGIDDATSGSISISEDVPEIYSYLLNCVGTGASGAFNGVTLEVQADPTPAYYGWFDLINNSSGIGNIVVEVGQSFIIYWGAAGAELCTGTFGPGTDNAWSQQKSTTGSNEVVSPPGSGTYSIVCANAGGAEASVSLTVTVPEGDGPGSSQAKRPWFDCYGCQPPNGANSNNFTGIEVYATLPQPGHPQLNRTYTNGWQKTTVGTGTMQMLQVVDGTNTLVDCIIGSGNNGCATAPMDISYITTGGALQLLSLRGSATANAIFNESSGAEIRVWMCADETCLPGSVTELESPAGGAALASTDGSRVYILSDLPTDWIYLELTIAPTDPGDTIKVHVTTP